MKKKLVLMDGHSILNRAFFGLPDLTNAKGVHTNAVYGFLNIMFKILEEEKPDYFTVAFDLHAPTFRHKMFDGYKGTRKPMADELRQQVPLIKEMLRAMGVRIVELEGYEADDILGTLSHRAEAEGMAVSVISGDRDLLQLATDNVLIRIPKTKKTGTEIENYYAKDVKELYLVSPKEFIDVKALMGDTSDNIPGVPGIGEKTASALIAEYGSIEAVHENAALIKPPRAGKNIVEFWEQAVMSKTLATIILDAPIEYHFLDARLESIESLYTQEAYLLCKELEFKNLLPRFHVDAPKDEASEYFCLVTEKKKAEEIFAKAKGQNVGFYIVENETKGKETKEEASGQLSLFDIPSSNSFEGMSLCFGEKDTYFFLCDGTLTSSWLIEKLMGVFQEMEKEQWMIANDLKPMLKYLDENQVFSNATFDAYQVMRSKFFDTVVATYLLNPLKGEYPYDDIAKDTLSLMLPSKQDLLGKMTPSQAVSEKKEALTKYACYESYVAWKAMPMLLEQLVEKEMEELFLNIEMPMVFVLSDMEQEGVTMDAKTLKEYGKSLASSIEKLEKEIYEAAGEEFNINSPKQLATILFEKLELPGGKKTKTGYSTSAEVLDKLAGEYPIVASILEYRQLTKLKSTYADGLPNHVDSDGKIRTSFHQTITATGRLSSTEPNLQNIPIRIELGRQIRKVFHATSGNCFVDSDYSQIELRVLAHMSGDENLIDAFNNGLDIHQSTASQVFHVPFDEVTPLQRRNAKAVNFGIVYGISAFGLSQDLNIERKEAQAYIDSYFATYPKIKDFLDKTVADAKENGYIRTMYGRIRPIPELSSSNFMQRQFGERIAMNSPIQGTAADIIKLAMIAVADRLRQEGLKSKLILQVHDELLIDTALDEKDTVIALLEEEMKAVASMAVTLEVGTACGDNWYEAH